MKVLFEDKHIIVIEKIAGIPTQAGKITEKDVVSEVNTHIRKAGAKASAYLIHRLDKPVRGVLVFAKTKEAAAALNKQLTSDVFNKQYYAYVEGCPSEKSGLLENYIYKDGNRAVITEGPDEAKGAKLARLKYEIIDEKRDNTTHICKLDIKLLTGRFHQIRCQLSNAGHPIVGDSLYGSSIPYEKRKAIGLIAYSLSFKHPVTNELMSFNLDED